MLRPKSEDCLKAFIGSYDCLDVCSLISKRRSSCTMASTAR